MRGECQRGLKPITVTQADDGKMIRAAKGGALIVLLQGNPGATGYAWGLETGDGAVQVARCGHSHASLPTSDLGSQVIRMGKRSV